MRDAWAIISTVFTLLGGTAGVIALVNVRPARKKMFNEAKKVGAEASEVVASSAITLLVPLQTRIEQLQSDLTAAQGQIATLQTTLEQERRASREERETSQRVIRELKEDIVLKDARILALGGGGGDYNNGAHPR